MQKKLSLAAKTLTGAMFCNNMLQKEQESHVLLFITHVQACLATIRLALEEEQLYAECTVILKNFYSSNLRCLCSSLLEINLNKAKYSV